MNGPSDQMRAAILAGPSDMRVQRVRLPEPGQGEVRVRLHGCGVCASNLPAWEGRSWFKYPFAPGAPGHEGWGEVDAVGANVTKAAVGDRVGLLSYHAFAEFDLASESALVRLPPALKKQPFPAEPLGCAFNVFRRCEIQPGQTVAIIGIGFLGAILTMLSVRAGARVLAISRRPFALELARSFGACETISLHDHRAIVQRVNHLTSGQGCERVIEAVGQQCPLDLASELTRERGRLVIAGYHQDGPRQINMQLWNWRGLDVINAHEREEKVYIAGMQAAVEAVSRGEIDPSPLYTHTFKLDGLPAALNAMRERPGTFLKALVLL